MLNSTIFLSLLNKQIFTNVIKSKSQVNDTHPSPRNDTPKDKKQKTQTHTYKNFTTTSLLKNVFHLKFMRE